MVGDPVVGVVPSIVAWIVALGPAAIATCVGPARVPVGTLMIGAGVDRGQVDSGTRLPNTLGFGHDLTPKPQLNKQVVLQGHRRRRRRLIMSCLHQCSLWIWMCIVEVLHGT